MRRAPRSDSIWKLSATSAKEPDICMGGDGGYFNKTLAQKCKFGRKPPSCLTE